MISASPNFSERALGNLEVSLAIAAVLILAVLFAFLRDWRSALVTFLAIPLSLLAAIAVLDRMGLLKPFGSPVTLVAERCAPS